jgi:hypothetical protein
MADEAVLNVAVGSEVTMASVADVFVMMSCFALVRFVLMLAVWFVVMVVFELHVELCSVDAAALLAGNLKLIAVQMQFFHFVFQLMQVHAKIQQRTDEHIAADPAEHVEVKRFHPGSPAASALI